ncbi:MerR family transcriptional regulator [Salidesulfovibrio brasiliensis]|uniref:MerR family transcriptional regulator n=1 Tax=Salidesulfovibrio brasiliensis TaxID=221711 RepID=UPI0006D2ABB3|nr:MerR family transcriptional regulator [Salidesulfovibrio brasiliensis]
MSETLTHKDLAKLCDVSETTIKSYRRKFPAFIPVETEGKPIRFKPEAGEVCLKIRDCFAKGMSVNATWKVLKEHFKEYKKDRRAASPAPQQPAPVEAAPSGVTSEYMEKFFETAGQMMHGMAQLATAQARADQRLKKLERAIEGLVEAESRNQDRFTQMLDVLSRGQGVPTPEAQPAPAAPEESPRKPEPAASEPEPEAPEAETPAPEPAPETPSESATDAEKPRPKRRIVNVRGREGVKRYDLGDEQPAASETEEKSADRVSLEHPSDTFMDTPIVIRNEQGEFLGVPGRLPLRGFIEILEREAGQTGHTSTWERRERSWVYDMKAANGERHELYFGGTKTPRGNLVVLLWRLDVDAKETTAAFLQEFFRQIKDRIAE